MYSSDKIGGVGGSSYIPVVALRKVRPREGRRLAEVVAESIEREVLESGWRVGAVLGSETELIDRLGVSRAVFREAVRIIEHDGVARMRRGPGGGLIVTRPDARAVRNAVAIYLQFAGVTRQQLFETRIALEVTAARLAAERASDEGIEVLFEAIKREQDGTPSAELLAHGRFQELHSVIAELSGNHALQLFIPVLTQLTHFRQPVAVSPDANAGRSHSAHGAIVEAIAERDASLAQLRMLRHLNALVEHFPEDESLRNLDILSL
jgi:DNA-binding FadR family transcriptional regulator